MAVKEYIERDKALEIVKRTSGDYAAAFSEIAHLPRTDAVEIVRCRDCKRYCAGYCVRDIGSRSNMLRMSSDDFCSYGERGKWDEL